ncbi:protein-L-isoaspartate(D-aspartate) O-methyltransferase [Bounagaea algeriensis]
MAPSRSVSRNEMVERLRGAGIGDRQVLEAMATVPRERFVSGEHAGQAYSERPLPIGAEQTISAPDIVAMMTAGLELAGGENVLEIGTGSGYAAAVLSRCARRVVTIERHRVLVDRARQVLAELGYDNVEVRHGDGSRGAPDRAPFEGISVTAMVEDVPTALTTQLADDGALVCPVGTGGVGELVRVRRGQREHLSPASFVPLVTDG